MSRADGLLRRVWSMSHKGVLLTDGDLHDEVEEYLDSLPELDEEETPHNGDPASIAAALNVEHGTQLWEVLYSFWLRPSLGITDEELAWMSGVDRARTRRKTLADHGLVGILDRNGLTAKGGNCARWQLTDLGMEKCREIFGAGEHG